MNVNMVDPEVAYLPDLPTTKVLRFMSANEALLLQYLDQYGGNLNNTTNHRERGQDSDAIGFCFAPIDLVDSEQIYGHALYLSGVTTMDVCLIGELKKGINWHTSEAGFSVGVKNELSTKEYSLSDFEDWAMYTPEIFDEVQLFARASRNWVAPVLAVRK